MTVFIRTIKRKTDGMISGHETVGKRFSPKIPLTDHNILTDYFTGGAKSSSHISERTKTLYFLVVKKYSKRYTFQISEINRKK